MDNVTSAQLEILCMLRRERRLGFFLGLLTFALINGAAKSLAGR